MLVSPRGAMVSNLVLKAFGIVSSRIIGELRGCVHTQRTEGVKKAILQISQN